MKKAGKVVKREATAEGGRLITRCAWCNSIRNNTGGWQAAKGTEQEGSFTHTICLTCLKNADPELHRVVSEILEKKQAVTKGKRKDEVSSFRFIASRSATRRSPD